MCCRLLSRVNEGTEVSMAAASSSCAHSPNALDKFVMSTISILFISVEFHKGNSLYCYGQTKYYRPTTSSLKVGWNIRIISETTPSRGC
jgi:hypothetical protein